MTGTGPDTSKRPRNFCPVINAFAMLRQSHVLPEPGRPPKNVMPPSGRKSWIRNAHPPVPAGHIREAATPVGDFQPGVHGLSFAFRTRPRLDQLDRMANGRIPIVVPSTSPETVPIAGTRCRSSQDRSRSFRPGKRREPSRPGIVTCKDSANRQPSERRIWIFSTRRAAPQVPSSPALGSVDPEFQVANT